MKRIFFLIGLALVGAFAAWHHFNPASSSLHSENVAAKTPMPVLASASLILPPRPLINFSLIDTNGQPFTTNSLLGQWTLLFFGYAQCPDTCPKTLVTLADTWNMLPEQPASTTPLQFLFVSLDPNSDTPENLLKFLNRFHPSFKGLTGDKNVIQQLSKYCSIYYWEDTTSKAIRKIDHSATLLLIDPQGKIKALFSPPYQKETLAKDLQALLQSAS